MSAPPMYLFLNHTQATPLAPVQERACPSEPSCTTSVAQGGGLSIKLKAGNTASTKSRNFSHE